jgi:uncharacterized membrane protein
MLIPIYAQKLFNTDAARWGINYHYSIEFVPVLTACTVVFITSIKIKNNYQYYLGFIVALLTGYYTYLKIENRVSTWYDKNNVMFYDQTRYQSLFDVKQLHKDIKQYVPDDIDSLAAQNVLVPHLTNRTHIYMFPHTVNANYILLAPQTNTYPLKDNYLNCIDTLKQSKYWQLTDSTASILLFKRK